MFKNLKTFYKYESGNRFLFGLFIFVAIITFTLQGITPYFYKIIVQEIQRSDYQKVFTIILIFSGVRMINLILFSLSFFLGDVVSFEGGKNVRIDVVKHIQDLDFAYHSEKSTGSLISAIKRGDGAFYDMHHSIHYQIFEVVIGFIIMFILLSNIDFKISLIVFISFFLNLLIMRYLISLNIKKRARFNEEEDKISGIITDNIINFDTVKFFAKEKWEENRLRRGFIDWKKALWGYANTFRLIDISTGSLINISIFIILYLAIKKTSNVNIDIGNFVLVLGFINEFFPRLFDMVYATRNIAKNFTDIEKYFNILDKEIKVKDPDKPINFTSTKGEIEFSGVTFTYKEKVKNAVNNIYLKIREGQSIALVGRSGSGKTTLIKLLMRFYDPQKGFITIDGIDIKKFKKSTLRSFFGVVPQEPILFNNTIGYNIGYGKENAGKKEIIAAAKLANIDKFIESLPAKYETNVGERGIKLSGGQKQRLAIARMILSEPEIIIFDEATSQLDSESERLIQDALWKVTKNKTTIIIAHRLSTVMKADKIIVIDKGKVVEEGSHKALLAKKDSLYTKFWNLQIKF